MKRAGAARQAQEWGLFRHALFFQSFHSLQRLDLAESFKGSKPEASRSKCSKPFDTVFATYSGRTEFFNCRPFKALIDQTPLRD